MTHKRRFALFWTAQGLSAGGDAFSLVAIPLLVLHETGSIVQMGLITALSSVGSITSGVFSGYIVDRVDRRRLMILCDGARGVLYGIIPILWFLTPGSPHIWLLYVVLPVATAFGMTFHIAYVAAVPSLVPREDLTAANGKLEATYAAMTLLGMALAGVVSSAFSPPTAVAVDAASFVASMSCLWAIRFDARTETESESSRRPLTRSEFLAGLQFIWRTPIMKSLTILLTLQTFFILGLVDVFIYHLKHNLSESDRAVGYVLAVATLGSMAAGGLVPYVRRALGLGRTWVIAYTTCGVVIALIGLSTNVFTVAALAVGFMFCTGVAGTCSVSLRQEITPSHLLGRVTSAFWTIHNSLGPIGAALVTVAIARYSVGGVALVMGVLMAAIAVSGLFTALCRTREPPAGHLELYPQGGGL